MDLPKSPGANLEKAIQRELPPSLAKKAPSISAIRAGDATLSFNFKGEASAYVGQLLDPKNTPKAPAKLVGSLLRFQRKNGLRANGFVDAATLKALEAKAPKPGSAPMKGGAKSAQDAIKGIANLKGAATKENIAKVDVLLETFDPETLKSIIDALQKTKKAVKPSR
ncbi:peptidoglycan-binding protein [Corallococcus aberystwythensis]|uniref:Peptidoglycan-binding protein n=1 Tax=Corallococcus aberystwythensis TaxID=2316722 RepID=A0A3A8PKM3_9BACT|nr:peptidoglycan-binding protein [Corallococcus aberystwythensis]